MNPQDICILFQGTLSPQPEIRKDSETKLKSLESVATFLPQLVHIVTTTEIDASIRLSVAVYLKNVIKIWWSATDENPTVVITENDRQTIKSIIIEAVVNCTPALRVHLCTCIHSILQEDYPIKWPAINDMVAQLLNSDNISYYHAGLLILKEMVAVYRWKTPEKREPLKLLVSNFFPIILSKSTQLTEKTDADIGTLVHLTLKMYYMSIQYEMSAEQRDINNLSNWGRLFISVIQKQIPETQLPDDEREKYPWMKAKKWAFHCIYHLFSKYADPSYNKTNKELRAFGKLFLNTFGPNILQVYLQQVELILNGVYTTKRVKQQLSLFFADAVRYKDTWKIIKPHIEPIISHFVFPQMCFNEEDMETFEDDPLEFIQGKLDPMVDYRSPVSASRELLISIIKNRFKITFMPILNFIHGIFQEDTAPGDISQMRRKDGAMSMLATIADYTLSDKSAVKQQMEEFLVNYVLPQFSSPNPLLIVRACETFMRFCEAEFSSNTLTLYYQALGTCMQHELLPVRAWAVLSMGAYLPNETFQEMLKPHAPTIMQVLLNLTNEIESDAVVEVMNAFVEYFSDELIPYAVQLAVQMRTTYMRIMGELEAAAEGQPDLDETAEKTMAAVAVLKTISSLILSVESSPKVLGELQEVVVPICRHALEKNMADVYDEIFDMIDTCSYCAKSISPSLWELFPFIHQCFKEDGVDFFEDMLPLLDNYITFGKDRIMSDPNYVNVFFNMVETILDPEEQEESNVIASCQLLESMMLNFSGSGVLNHLLPKIVQYGIKLMSDFEDKEDAYKVHVLEILVNAIYYDAFSTLTLMAEGNLIEGWMRTWMSELESFIRVHDKKLSILAICCLLQLLVSPTVPDAFKASLAPSVPYLIGSMVKLFKKYPEALEERKRMADMMAKGEFYDDDFDDEDFNASFEKGDDQDDDDVYNDDDAYLNHLNAQSGGAGDDDLESDEADDDDDLQFGMFGLEEDPYFMTVLDDVDPYAEAKQTLHVMPQEIQQQMVTGLDKESMEFLTRILA